jgi:predicted kinase
MTAPSNPIPAELERLHQSLGPLPDPVAKPLFILVSGLPGTGKSFLSRKLAAALPLKVLETDALRKVLWSHPTYSAEESSALFSLVHQLIAVLLGKGVCVLLDATNLQERYREHLYSIAEQVGAKLIILRTEAPPDVIAARLKARIQRMDPEDRSSADWQVYHRMRSSVEPISRPHYLVDTSQPIEPVVQKITREARKWMRP